MKIEKLEKEPITKLGVLLAILLFVIYVGEAFFVAVFPDEMYYFVSSLGSIFVILCAILFFKNRLKRDITALKNNNKAYAKFIITNMFMMYGVYYAVSIICVLILGSADASANQTALETMPSAYLIFSALIFAPIVEELLFRGSIRRIIKNDVLFVIISGLIFGSLHVVMEPTWFEFIFRGLPYVTLGMYFSYVYVRTENITVSMICHFIQNVLAVSMMFLIK